MKSVSVPDFPLVAKLSKGPLGQPAGAAQFSYALFGLGAALQGQDVVLSVKDNGVGIPPEEIPRIWERLYRGDKSRSQKGLGLGLSLVRAVVQAHHGAVEVSSQPEQGSEFTVRLPRAGKPKAD